MPHESIWNQDAIPAPVKTGKEAVFTPARWASFRLYIDEVDDQLNSLSQDRDVAYCAHYGGGWHVSVNTGYRCVDLRKWYVPLVGAKSGD